VNGTCNENVLVRDEVERITIDGQGTATINGPDATRATVQIRGRNINLTGLTITGGEDGINIARGGSATVVASTVQDTGRSGIIVNQNGSLRVTNSKIQNNLANGIAVLQNSTARIGFLTFEGLETIPGGVGPNLIQGNGANGIRVADSSDADIVENTISGNQDHGILVDTVSHALIASNTINANGQDGVRVGRNSGVNLGRTTTATSGVCGVALDDAPNTTTTNNTGFGIGCFINSYADGCLSTLNGSGGQKNFPSAAACIDSLDP
jgi:parallel beta-helix repeat protein